jgi:hypothetical protein
VSVQRSLLVSAEWQSGTQMPHTDWQRCVKHATRFPRIIRVSCSLLHQACIVISRLFLPFSGPTL